MAITRAGAITAAAKAVSMYCENKKRRKSPARTHKCHKTQSEEQQSEILQTNWMGHAERHARLSAVERHAERHVHHDMGVIHKEKDSCDNCHRKDFSIDPRYKLTFTVVSNKEICTCKLAKVKSRRVHDPVIFFTLCQECKCCLNKTPNYLSMMSSQKEHMFDWKNIWPLFLWDILSGFNASDNVPYYQIERAESLWRMTSVSFSTVTMAIL
jgi:hypothetical protein